MWFLMIAMRAQLQSCTLGPQFVLPDNREKRVRGISWLTAHSEWMLSETHNNRGINPW